MCEYKFDLLLDKDPVGAIECGKPMTYTFRVAQNIFVDKIIFSRVLDGTSDWVETEMTFDSFEEGYKVYKTTVVFGKVGLYWYNFKVVGKQTLIVQQGEEENSLSVGTEPNNSFSQIVTDKKVIMHLQELGGVIYHIFVDRFAKSGKVESRSSLNLKNNWTDPMTDTENYDIINKECYGGNLRGIIEKLDYIKSLNTKVIYLSPIFYAESYHKYDTADYEKIDPMFGSLSDLEELVKKAKERGMIVILDGVFNHVGSDSKYFNKFGKFVEVGAYQSLKSKYVDWFNFYDWPDSYEKWWGVPTLPCMNESNNEFRKYICGKNGIIERYMKLGIGGFRLDVVDELTDSFLTEICQKIYSMNKDALIIGEVWEDAAKKISYDHRRQYLWGHQLNSVTNYPLRTAILEFLKTGNGNEIANCMDIVKDDYPRFVQYNLMNLIGSHDTSRIANEIESIDAVHTKELTKMATLLEYSFIGIPTIFYGDEVGTKNLRYNISRTPYPWGRGDASLLYWFKRIGELRSLKSVVKGSYEIVENADGVIVVLRQKDEEKVYVICNNKDSEYKITMPEKYTEIVTGTSAPKKTFTVPPFGVLVLKNYLK